MKQPIKNNKSKKKESVPHSIVKAWRLALIEFGKFPRGTPISEKAPLELVKILARREVAAITELRETYTQKREHMRRGLLTHKKDLIAYLLGFHLANASRFQGILTRMQKREGKIATIINRKSHVNIIDLGCGSGVMSQVWINELAPLTKKTISAHLVEPNKVLLTAANSLLKHMDSRAEVFSHKTPVESYRWPEVVEDSFSIYNLGYLWNEISSNKNAQRHLLGKFSSITKKNEAAMIVVQEPGSQDQSRSAMELRDQLIGLGYVALYPCPHQNTCPMLERSRDWCYSELEWHKPMEQEYIDKLTEASRHVIAISAFVFISPAAAKALSHERAESAPIVVGRPLLKKSPKDQKKSDKFSYLVCSPKGSIEKESADPRSKVLRRGESWKVVKPRAPQPKKETSPR